MREKQLLLFQSKEQIKFSSVVLRLPCGECCIFSSVLGMMWWGGLFLFFNEKTTVDRDPRWFFQMGISLKIKRG
jgi:hypothetical protein